MLFILIFLVAVFLFFVIAYVYAIVKVSQDKSMSSIQRLKLIQKILTAPLGLMYFILHRSNKNNDHVA